MASERSRSSKKAWEKRPHWFEGEKKAIARLERDGYQILAYRGGYPDIMAEKNGRLSFIEVKRGKDPLRDEQKIAILSLKKHGHDVHVWRFNPAIDDFEEGSLV